MTDINIDNVPSVWEFKAKYNNDVLNDLLSVLLDEGYDECDDDQCDDERCLLRKAFKQYIKYRND